MAQDPRNAVGVDFEIGAKLRLRRKVKKLSLSTVAAGSQISTGQLSQIERGLCAPSLRTLRSICDALDMPMGWLFSAEEGADARSAGVVLRAGSRRHLDLSHLGMTKELMTPDSFPDIQMMLITIKPNGTSGNLPYANASGTKCGTVVEGTLGLEIDGSDYELAKGDSFAFDARQPHRFRCIGDEECQVLWVTSPALY